MCLRCPSRISVALLIVLSNAAVAQEFTVASVREITIDDPSDPRYIAAPDYVPKRFGERVVMRNRLADIIAWSFNLRDKSFELVSDAKILDLMFEIEAIASEPVTDADLRAMFRALLEERFKLKTRQERREVALYDMTVSAGGLKIAPLPADQQRITLGFGGSATWVELSDEGRILHGKGASLEELAAVAGKRLGAPVRNRTGLSGAFNYEVRFSDGMDDTSGPSFVSALGDLGLKLQKSAGFIDVLRVEHVERPSQN